MQDKEDEKKEKVLEKEKRKEERERKKAEKIMATTKKDTGSKKVSTQEASVKSTNKKTRKGKGKATVKGTRDLDTCPICMQSYETVGFKMGDWIQYGCKQWMHKDCIDYNFTEPNICPKCAGLDLYVVFQKISIKFSTLVPFRHVGNIPEIIELY